MQLVGEALSDELVSAGRGSRSLLSSGGLPLFFDGRNGLAQPISKYLLDFQLVAVAAERYQRVAFRIEGDKPAGNLFGPKLWRHELKQNALAARDRMLLGIIIGATGRILEYQRLPPGLAWRSAISAFFQENQFRLQNLQDVSLIFVHGSAPTILVWPGGPEGAVTRVTLGCAPCHRKSAPPVVHL